MMKLTCQKCGYKASIFNKALNKYGKGNQCCPHCNEPVKIKMNYKRLVITALILIIIGEVIKATVLANSSLSMFVFPMICAISCLCSLQLVPLNAKNISEKNPS